MKKTSVSFILSIMVLVILFAAVVAHAAIVTPGSVYSNSTYVSALTNNYTLNVPYNSTDTYEFTTLWNFSAGEQSIQLGTAGYDNAAMFTNIQVGSGGWPSNETSQTGLYSSIPSGGLSAIFLLRPENGYAFTSDFTIQLWGKGYLDMGGVGPGYQTSLNINIDVADAPAVPIPAAFWLLGSGLVGLIGVRRFNK